MSAWGALSERINVQLLLAPVAGFLWGEVKVWPGASIEPEWNLDSNGVKVGSSILSVAQRNEEAKPAAEKNWTNEKEMKLS